MSNNDLLTDAELASWRPDPTMVDRLERCRSRFGVAPADFRIVDWGCGRGKLVLWLRERGYDAFGVDIDPAAFANGVDLFRRKGHPPERYLHGLSPSGRAPLEDASVHFITSWQTLEHVRDLDAVAREWSRTTMEGGAGFHIYPAHRRLTEPHLFMPFVHWLPKNAVRRLAINMFVLARVEPRWWPDEDVATSEMARRYYEYSIHETFYRSPADIHDRLTSKGFETEFVDVQAGSSHWWITRWVHSRAPSAIRNLYRTYGKNVGLATYRREHHDSSAQAQRDPVMPVRKGEQAQG